jgi:hypothetical protein
MLTPRALPAGRLAALGATTNFGDATLAVLVALATAVAGGSAQQPTLDEVLDRLGVYLLDYESYAIARGQIDGVATYSNFRRFETSVCVLEK